jgi:hypothetical protein
VTDQHPRERPAGVVVDAATLARLAETIAIIQAEIADLEVTVRNALDALPSSRTRYPRSRWELSALTVAMAACLLLILLAVVGSFY